MCKPEYGSLFEFLVVISYSSVDRYQLLEKSVASIFRLDEYSVRLWYHLQQEYEISCYGNYTSL
jgi:hypothetical protein